jgi:hypothetical protein
MRVTGNLVRVVLEVGLPVTDKSAESDLGFLMSRSPGKISIPFFSFFVWFILVKGSIVHFYSRIISSANVHYVLRYETLRKA